MPDGTVIHMGKEKVKHMSYELFRNPSGASSPYIMYRVQYQLLASVRQDQW